MAKVTEANFNVGIQHIPLGYMQDNGPNLQPIAAGLADMGQAFARVEAEQKAKADTMKRYGALTSLQDFEVNSKLRAQEELKNAAPNDTGVAQRVVDSQIKYEQEFVKTLPPELQPEFAVRADSIRGGITLDAHATQDKLNNTYYKEDIKQGQNQAALEINKDPGSMEKWKSDMDARIDASGLSESEKYFAKQENARLLETYGYGATLKQEKLTAAQYTNDLATAATQASKQLGISPVDLLTVISYETGGTFNVNQKGGAGGRYKGLIQFGPEEQRKYGIHDGMSVGEQMGAVVQFLQDRGFKPGMTIYDLYSTINAGSPGHYNASDAHNGGAPGTVADKVRNQMGDHRVKAEALLGGKFEVPSTIDSDPRFQNVLYEDRVAAQTDAASAVNSILAEQAATQKAAYDQQLNGLEVGLLDGTKGAADIEAARNDGWLTDYEAIAKVQGILDKKQKEGADLATFMTRLTRGDALDPNNEENKKGMNLYNQQMKGEEKLQSMDQSYVETLGNNLKATGMLPSDAVGVLGAMTRSADGRKALFAYESLNILQNQNPEAFAKQVDEKLAKKADIYDMLSDTMPEKDLLEQLRENPSAEVQRGQDLLEERAKKVIDDPNNTDITFAKVLDHFGADTVEAGPAGAAMEQDWRDLYLYYSRHGATPEQANAKAMDTLGQKWGKTEFDGSSILMKYPVEKTYPPIAKSWDYITNQARGLLGLTPDENVQLVSDDRTANDIANGKPASYIPLIKDSYGQMVPATGYPDVQQVLPPGSYQPGNIDIHDRPQVKNADGSVSTVKTISYGTDQGDVLIPTVSDEGKEMSNDEAIAYWRQKGQNLGVFKSAADADLYAQALHEQQYRQYVLGERVVKRISFEPSKADQEVADKQSVLDNINARIKALEGEAPGAKARYLNPPPVISGEIEKLKADRAAAQAMIDGAKGAASAQYKTPAQNELEVAQKEFAPLQAEMQAWTDPIEQWPKVHEWEKLYDRIDMLKKKAAAEALKKRSSGGVQ